ncbi:MAG: DUF2846 domain-containing protein [Burkholderiales bacterium]|nr:DUF2846 domain-containing protein [Burkholderiales bacterium]
MDFSRSCFPRVERRQLLTLALTLAGGAACAQVGAALSPLAPGRARVYFFRDDSSAGPDVQPVIRLDGVAVGRSQPGGYFVVDVPPGEHTASTSDADARLPLDLAAGSATYVSSNIGAGLGGRVRLEVQPEAAARRAIAGLRLTTGSSPPGTPPAQGGRPGSAPAAAAAVRHGPVTMDDLSGLLPPKR